MRLYSPGLNPLYAPVCFRHDSPSLYLCTSLMDSPLHSIFDEVSKYVRKCDGIKYLGFSFDEN